MFTNFKIKMAIKRETKKEIKAIMDGLYKEMREGTATRPLREDEKLMIDLAKLELYAQTANAIRNA